MDNDGNGNGVGSDDGGGNDNATFAILNSSVSWDDDKPNDA